MYSGDRCWGNWVEASKNTKSNLLEHIFHYINIQTKIRAISSLLLQEALKSFEGVVDEDPVLVGLATLQARGDGDYIDISDNVC